MDNKYSKEECIKIFNSFENSDYDTFKNYFDNNDLDISIYKLTRLFKKYQVQPSGAENMQKALAMYYDNCSYDNIYYSAHVHHRKLLSYLKDNNFDLRPDCFGQKINYNYFYNIDNEEKAYMLGYIYSNSQITAAHNLSISFVSTEYPIFRKLANFAGSFRDIKKYKRPSTGIIIRNKKILYDIQSYSKTFQSKNKEILLDKIPIELHRHLLRGLLEGANFVISNMKSYAYFQTVDSGIYNAIICLANNNGIKVYTDSYENKKYSLSVNNIRNKYIKFYGHQNFYKMLSLLYKDTSIGLSGNYRKYNNRTYAR